MHDLGVRRGKAYARDCVGYLAIAAALVPLGLLGHRAGWGRNRAYVLAVSAVPPVAATLLAAAQEARPRGATWGKRRYRLEVVDLQGARIGVGRALVRNTVKIALPWQLGHTAAIGAAFGDFDDPKPATIAATALTYPLIGVLVAGVLAGSGRAPQDRLAGTRVRATT